MEKLADNGIIQEATEAVTKGYPSAFYVPQLLEVIKNKEAEILNLNKEISALKLKNDEFLNLNEKAKGEIEKKQSAYELCKQEYDSMFNANRNLLAEVERLQKLQKPTETSGFKIENGKVVFYTNMLNGYRHEYKNLDEVVKELNLLLQNAYKTDDVMLHYKGKAKTARFEAYREFAERFNELLKEYAPYDTLHIYEIKDRIDITGEELTEITDQTATNQSVSLIDGHIEG